MSKFNQLTVFLTVVSEGSFAATAKKLGTNPSTISKSIERLEKELSFRLFQRTTRKLKLTHAGQVYKDKVFYLFNELSNCEEALKDDKNKPTGTLKINAPVGFGLCHIRPLIPIFSSIYPDIKIETCFDDRYVDIINEGFDVSIRTGEVQDSRFIARHLCPIHIVTCAAQSYLNKFDNNIYENDYLKHDWILHRFKESKQTLPILLKKEVNIKSIKHKAKFIVDDALSMKSFCEAGLGLSQLPHFILGDSIQTKKLIALNQTIEVPNSGIYIIYPNKEFLPYRVRLFIDFIIKHKKAFEWDNR